MDPFILIFLLLAGVIVFPLVRYLLTERHDSDIHAYLLSKGATDINVSYSYMLSDGNSQGYVVEYTTQHGKRCKTRCLIRNRKNFFSEDGIDWLEPPEV